MKRCKKCGRIKSYDEFSLAADTADGRRGDCKECFRKSTNSRNAANPEPNRRRTRQWQIDNPERVREQAARQRQKVIASALSYLGASKRIDAPKVRT